MTEATLIMAKQMGMPSAIRATSPSSKMIISGLTVCPPFRFRQADAQRTSRFHKMEKYQNMLYKIAINKYYDELIKKLKSSALIDEELSALYTRFDKVFLGLYPTFVSDFNALLKDEEKIILKPDALLNRELRIYALLRLGITDSGKIANFLRCSTSTVYNYRTKMRNKAAVDRDEFENEIMKISSTQET